MVAEKHAFLRKNTLFGVCFPITPPPQAFCKKKVPRIGHRRLLPRIPARREPSRPGERLLPRVGPPPRANPRRASPAPGCRPMPPLAAAPPPPLPPSSHEMRIQEIHDFSIYFSIIPPSPHPPPLGKRNVAARRQGRAHAPPALFPPFFLQRPIDCALRPPTSSILCLWKVHPLPSLQIPVLRAFASLR